MCCWLIGLFVCFQACGKTIFYVYLNICVSVLVWLMEMSNFKFMNRTEKSVIKIEMDSVALYAVCGFLQ